MSLRPRKLSFVFQGALEGSTGISLLSKWKKCQCRETTFLFKAEIQKILPFSATLWRRNEIYKWRSLRKKKCMRNQCLEAFLYKNTYLEHCYVYLIFSSIQIFKILAPSLSKLMVFFLSVRIWWTPMTRSKTSKYLSWRMTYVSL